MKQRSSLALMMLSIAIVALLNASMILSKSHQVKKVSTEVSDKDKVSCSALTIAVLENKKGDVSKIVKMAKDLHNNCGELDKKARSIIKKVHDGADLTHKDLKPLVKASANCSAASMFHKKVQQVYRAMMKNKKNAKNISKLVTQLPGEKNSNSQNKSSDAKKTKSINYVEATQHLLNAVQVHVNHDRKEDLKELKELEGKAKKAINKAKALGEKAIETGSIEDLTNAAKATEEAKELVESATKFKTEFKKEEKDEKANKKNKNSGKEVQKKETLAEKRREMADMLAKTAAKAMEDAKKSKCENAVKSAELVGKAAKIFEKLAQDSEAKSKKNEKKENSDSDSKINEDNHELSAITQNGCDYEKTAEQLRKILHIAKNN